MPATVSFRLENEKWGEVFKLHPVLKLREGLELRIFVTIKQFDGRGGKELPPEVFLCGDMAVNPEENKQHHCV